MQSIRAVCFILLELSILYLLHNASKLAGDPEKQGVQVGESAQERSALAELYSGYQAKYGSNAVKEYMLGMNFGYDSVGDQTTA